MKKKIGSAHGNRKRICHFGEIHQNANIPCKQRVKCEFEFSARKPILTHLDAFAVGNCRKKVCAHSTLCQLPSHASGQRSASGAACGKADDCRTPPGGGKDSFEIIVFPCCLRNCRVCLCVHFPEQILRTEFIFTGKGFETITDGGEWRDCQPVEYWLGSLMSASANAKVTD
ncbi:MAG TPA: hypothetical protein VIK62_07610 [Verrucomicrobiae bacterium]